MDLRLNRKSTLSITAQLKAQLAHLIQAGELAAGRQLPTVRQLAGFLRINRNTVSKVFAELEREGYLSCEPGRGTFVSPPRAEAGARSEKMRDMLTLVEEAIAKARGLGVSPAEFAAALYARAQTAPASGEVRKVPALFVECNRPQLEAFSKELEEALPLRLDTILVKDLERMVRKTPRALRKYPLVVTTFFHAREIEQLLAGTGTEVVSLLAEASLDTLLRLTALSEGTKVGAACNSWEGTENVKMSIQNAGLRHLQLVPGCGENMASLRRMVKQASVVVCSSLVAKKIQALAPKGMEILVDDRRLDQSGIEMLRRRLGEIQRRDGDRRLPGSRRAAGRARAAAARTSAQ